MTKNEDQKIQEALSILERRLKKHDEFINNPDDAENFAILKTAELEHEVFGILYLNIRLALIEYNEMFRGTLDGAAVYPREVAKRALEVNAAAVIFIHNHPSGVTTPSNADRTLTHQLSKALGLFNVRVLDHFVVGHRETFSFAENGLL